MKDVKNRTEDAEASSRRTSRRPSVTNAETSVNSSRNPRARSGGRKVMSDQCGTLRVGVLSVSIEDEGGRWTWALS
jgi:hypothetical protein